MKAGATGLILLWAAWLGGGAFVLAGAGQVRGASAAESLPKLIGVLIEGGAEVKALEERGGLRGFLVKPKGMEPYTVYVAADGHMVIGLLYGPDGLLLTAKQLEEARDVPVREPIAPAAATGGRSPVAEAGGGPAGRDRLFKRSAAAFGFTLGGRGPLAVVFGDAACPWSRAAVATLGSEALKGRLRLRVVPVGVLGAVSARRAAGIAASKDPALTWFEDGGGAPDETGAKRIIENNTLFEAWGETAVPLIAWRNPGGRVAHNAGEIVDLAAWLKDLGLE